MKKWGSGKGIQRDGYYYDQQYADFVMMSILEDEYRTRRQMPK